MLVDRKKDVSQLRRGKGKWFELEGDAYAEREGDEAEPYGKAGKEAITESWRVGTERWQHTKN